MVYISSMHRMNGILLADRPLPEEERYDGYLQLENGVGMLRLLYEEVKGGSGDDRRWMHPASPSCLDGNRTTRCDRIWKSLAR